MNYQELIKRALDEGFTDIEIYSQHQKGLSISVFDGAIDKNTMNNTISYSIRGIYNDKMAYVTSEDPNEDIDFIIQKLKENAKVLTTDEEFEIFAGSRDYKVIEKEYSDFYLINPKVKVDMLKKLESLVKQKDPRIVFVPYCRYSEVDVTTEIVNSKGLNLSNTNRFAFIMVGAVSREGTDQKSAYEIKAVNKFEDFNIEELAEKVVKRSVSLLGAEPVESKFYPVIFENEAMTEILGAFQSMFSGESAIRKTTLLLGKENEKIMSEKITIVDDPFHKDAIIVSPFDDEGVACYEKDVVSNGVFKTFLHNLKTARYFKTTSTGNGFKAGISSYAGVRGANLIIKPGTTSLEEMIKDTKEGLLITDVAGLHSGSDPASGNFSIQSTGYLINNGKIVRPVNLIVVSGNFLKMMNDVEVVGSDLDVSYRGVGAPSIKFTSLSVSGK